MTAITTNASILAAANQIIQALLDQIAAGGNCPDVTVNNDIPVPSVTVNVAAPNVSYTVYCGGGGGGGYAPGTGDTPPAEPAPEPNPASDPPEGFDTWGQFWVYKCKAANAIVDGIKWWFNHFSSFSGQSSVVGVAGTIQLALGVVNALLLDEAFAASAAYLSVYGTVGLIAGNAALLYAIGLALIALAIGGVAGWVVLGNAADAMEENREDLVCALYNSTPTTARIDFLSALNTILDGWATQSFISDLADILLPNDIVNLMFTKQDKYDILGSKDCNCSGDCGNSGTVQHFPTFSAETDYAFSDLGGGRYQLTASVDTGYGRRYSIFFGGPVEGVYSARKLVNIELVAGTLNGNTAGGYLVFYDVNGTGIAEISLFHQDALATVNSWLDTNKPCVSISSGSYFPSATTIILTFE